MAQLYKVGSTPPAPFSSCRLLAVARVHTVLYHFTGGTDGGEPYKGVTLDAAGNLYGTAVTGGGGFCEGGCGVTYKLTKSGGQWTQTVIHAFTGGDDGSGPGSPVVLDKAGNVYGNNSDRRGRWPGNGISAPSCEWPVDLPSDPHLHRWSGWVDGLRGPSSFRWRRESVRGCHRGRRSSGWSGLQAHTHPDWRVEASKRYSRSPTSRIPDFPMAG